MIDQGFIDAPEVKEAPVELEYMLLLHKEIRFARVPPNTLIPREPLTFSDLNEYQNISRFKLSAIESDVIMRVDGIYNNSTN